MRRIAIVVLGSALLAGTVLPSFAQEDTLLRRGGPGQMRGPGVGASQPLGRSSGPGSFAGNRPQFGGGGARFGGDRGDDGFRRRGHHHGGYGAAIGAGVAGLAAGALIGGALGGPAYGGDYGDNGYYGPAYAGPGYAPEAVEDAAPEESAAYCQRRYRSYDVASGTYLGYDGQRHPCP